MSEIVRSRRAICAIGSAIIGLVLWLQITSGGVSLLAVGMAIWVTFCAGLGGYFCARLFGRGAGSLWKAVAFVSLGGMLATLLGSVIGGGGIGFIILIGGEARMFGFSLIAGPIAVIKTLFFSDNMIALSIWILGFVLLEVVVRKFAADI